MTVADLIAALGALDPGLPVVNYDDAPLAAIIEAETRETAGSVRCITLEFGEYPA